MTISILIADKLAPQGPRWLDAQTGVEVDVQTGLAEDELANALRQHHGVVVRSAVQITEPVLDSAMSAADSRLRGIARAGVGVDNIDLPAATRHGIAVLNSASASTITTAEHAFALMIALSRNIAPAASTMAAGGWDRGKFVGRQLHGRTLGVVGAGRIGRTLADRALAFGMKVIGYDPYVNAEAILDGRVPLVGRFDELVEQVDIISFHVPRTDDTAGMLGAEQFRRARAGLLVVNAARGGIVDETALLEALETGHCGGAAIDVFPTEPPPADDPLRAHPRVLTTPHLGASTEEAQEAVAVDACRALLAYLRGQGLQGAVNVSGLSLDLTRRQHAFVDLGRRMIALLAAAADAAHPVSFRLALRGGAIASRADTITRHTLAAWLQRHLDQPVNIINAPLLAEGRGIVTETTITSEQGDDRITVEITMSDGSVAQVEGAIYEDGLPRVTSLLDYKLDMVPAGSMVLLTNRDEPGRIGLVGQLFGDAGVNIAEMVIGRRADDDDGDNAARQAMMILKLDAAPDDALRESLRASPGILHVSNVELPALNRD